MAACSCEVLLAGCEHLQFVGSGRLAVAVIESGEREPESPRQIEVQGIVALQVITPRKFHHAAPRASASAWAAVRVERIR